MASPAPPRISAERRRTVDQLAALATELAGRDRAVAELLTLLAEALEHDRREDVRAYAGAIPPRAVAEDLTQKHRTVWGIAEVVRAALVLVPIALTWYGFSAASAAYAELLDAKPELAALPFLLLWQRGFDGHTAITFSTLAAVDGILISVIIALSLVLQYKDEITDPRMIARALLRESQVRALLARAVALSPSATPGEIDPDVRASTPAVAAALEGMNTFATQLAELAAAVRDNSDRGIELQQALVDQTARAAARDLEAAAALDAIRREVSVSRGGASALVSEANGLAREEETRLITETERLVSSLNEVRKAQQIAMGSVTLQTDAMNYMAKALVLASERVQIAAQALGDATVPRDMFRRSRWWRRLWRRVARR